MLRVLAITLARVSQFSAILDVLRRDMQITLLAPERTGTAPGLRVLPFTPAAPPRYGSSVEQGQSTFLETARAVTEATLGLRGEKFDVIFGQASFGCLHTAPLLFPAGVVAHVELAGMEMAMARREFPMTEEDILNHENQRLFTECSLFAADRVITPSAYARSLLPLMLQPRVRVCMEGFPIGPVRTDSERGTLRRHYDLPERIPILAYFGRTLEAVRGFDIFVRTAKKVRRAVPNAAFLVVGEPVTLYGGERRVLGNESFRDHSLRQAGMSVSDFLFRRTQPRLVFRQLASAVDAAMFPIFENAGNWSFFDCIAEGTPTVASRRCFFPEVITDGESGFLCDAYDIDAYSERCVALLTDTKLQRRVGEAGRAVIKDRFTLKHAAERYRQVFAEAADER